MQFSVPLAFRAVPVNRIFATLELVLRLVNLGCSTANSNKSQSIQIAKESGGPQLLNDVS